MRGRHSSGVPAGAAALFAVAGVGLLLAAGLVAILTLRGPGAQQPRRGGAVATEPGYGPNPGHAGTGTVVIVICRAGESSGGEEEGGKFT